MIEQKHKKVKKELLSSEHTVGCLFCLSSRFLSFVGFLKIFFTTLSNKSHSSASRDFQPIHRYCLDKFNGKKAISIHFMKLACILKLVSWFLTSKQQKHCYVHWSKAHYISYRLTFLYILGLVSIGAFIVTDLAFGFSEAAFLAAEDIVSNFFVWLLAFIGSKIDLGDLTFSPFLATFLSNFWCYSIWWKCEFLLICDVPRMILQNLQDFYLSLFLFHRFQFPLLFFDFGQ